MLWAWEFSRMGRRSVRGTPCRLTASTADPKLKGVEELLRTEQPPKVVVVMVVSDGGLAVMVMW